LTAVEQHIIACVRNAMASHIGILCLFIDITNYLLIS